MPITVTKISEAFYTASAVPPHVDEPWSALEPLRMHPLCEELIARGAHQVDVGDAINDADRVWLQQKQDERL
jgi:hypothetical protein